ncbi:PKD domain-containing protein [bacterium]|nr:PKD domain-containing protein [bacterium]
MNRQLTALLLGGMLLLVACSAGNGDPASRAADDRVLPQFESQLPAIADLPARPRNLSNTPDACIRKGSDIHSASAKLNAELSGDRLSMSPAYEPQAEPPSRELSWGMYGFNIADYQRGTEIQAKWNGNVPASSGIRIGVSDYSSGRWQWQQGTPGGTVDFPDLADYFSANGDLYVVVLLAASGEYSFDRLRLGGNFPPLIDYTIDDDSAQGKLTMNINASASTDPEEGFVYRWEWSPEGGPFEGTSDFMYWEYDHVAEYDCTIRAFDIEGAMSEIVVPISVTAVPGNDPPVADIYSDDDVLSGLVPLAVSLNAQNSTDPENGFMTFRWDIDEDGYFEQFTFGSPVFKALYIAAGTYNPSVMVIDEFGAIDIATMQIEVLPATGTEPPVARLEAVYWYDHAPGERYFTAQGSYDPDNDIVKYEWDFEGDGTFDVETFDSVNNVLYGQDGGIFDVTVRVTDSGGRSDTASCPVMLLPFSGQPEIEPNDSPETAISMGSFAGQCVRVNDYPGQLRFGEDTEDWYVIHAAHNGPLWLNVIFTHEFMDIDTELYGSSDLENPLFTGYSEDDNEFLSLVITAPGDYYLRVFTDQAGEAGQDSGYKLDFWDPVKPVAFVTASATEVETGSELVLNAGRSYDRYLEGLIYFFDMDGDGIFESEPGGWLSTGTVNWEGPQELGVKVQDMLGMESIATVSVTGIAP